MFKKALEQVMNRLFSEPFNRRLKQRIGIKSHAPKAPDLPLSRCEQSDGFIHIYTDGSCNYNKRLLGIGAVIPDQNEKVKFTFSRRIIPSETLDLDRLGAMKAEFMAVTYTLNQLPDKTNVHIFTDHPLLRQTLNRHIACKKSLFAPWQQKINGFTDLKEMVNDLKDALSRKGQIKVTQLNDTQSRRMQEAHTLAAKGSGAKGIKKRLSDKPVQSDQLEQESENAFLIGDPRDPIPENELQHDYDPQYSLKPRV